MSKSKSLKFSLTRKDVNATYGENVELSADLSTVKDVILGAVDTLGAQKCLALGAVATATYVLVKSIARKWPWAKVTDVEGDTIKVTVPQNKEDKLVGLLQNMKIEERLKDDFENMDENLEGILGEEYETHGSAVAEILKDIRVASIAPKSDLPENLQARKIIRGKHQETQRDALNVFAVGESSGGVKADTFVDAGGNLTTNSTGVTNIMTVGMRGKDYETTMETAQKIAGSKIRIKIMGDHLKKTFEENFKPGTTVYEVLRELKEVEKRQVDAKVVLKRKKQKEEEILDDMQMLVEQLGKPGDTVILWAEFPEST